MAHIAVARLVAPGGDLARAQPGARVGPGVIAIEPLLGSVQQVHAPGVSVALLDALRQLAIGRSGIDAGQHRLLALEDLVVQTPTRTSDRSCARSITPARCAACTTQV